MTRMNESMMLGFADELKKLAKVNPRVGSAATLGILGALGGAGAGYLKHHLTEQDPEASSLGSVARGALAGGLGGAGLGAVLPSGARQAVSRFGVRELHGLTGHIPEGESLRSMHAGAYPARLQEAQAARALGKAQRSGGDVEKAQHALEQAQIAHKAMQGAEDWGMTSLPGVAKAVKKHGLIPTVARGAQAQIAGAHPLNKALMLGLPAYSLAGAAMGQQPEGAGRGEEVGYTGGQLVGGLAGGLLPFGVGQVLQEGMGRVGRSIGKGADVVAGKVMRKGQPSDHGFRSYGPNPSEASDLTKGHGQSTPSETIMTARASGYPPETQA